MNNIKKCKHCGFVAQMSSESCWCGALGSFDNKPVYKKHTIKHNMNTLKQLLSFLNEETPIKNSQIILETIFLLLLILVLFFIL
jgi:hypothetical protein